MAVYTVAYRLLETVLFVTYAINAAVLPVLSATASRETRSARLRAGDRRRRLRLPALRRRGAHRGRGVIDLLFGATYAAAAAPVLAWLAPAAMLLAMASFTDSLLHVLGRHRALLASSSVGAAASTSRSTSR